MKEIESIIRMLPYMAPLIGLGAILLVIALVDLARRKHVTGGHKVIWVLVAVGIQIIGPVIYLLLGRKEEAVDSD